MSRGHDLLGLALLLAAFVGDASALAISSVRASGVTTQGAIIRWTTDEAVAGRVNCGPSPAYGRTVDETGPTKDHYVFLDALTPGATYHFQVQAGDATAADATFTTAAKIEDLWPVVSLSFDDGHISHLTAAFPLMKARDMRGAVNVITDRLAIPVGLSLAQVQFLQAQGWAVDSHSRAHNRVKGLTDEDEVVGSITFLEANGIKKVQGYRVPGSNHSAAREALAAARYPLRWGNVKGATPSPRYTTLPLAPGMYAGMPLDFRQNASREERIAKYQAAVDEVLSKHLYTHFIFHAIVPTTPDGYHYPPDEFEALLDYLQAKGIKVIPPGELLQTAPPDLPSAYDLPPLLADDPANQLVRTQAEIRTADGDGSITITGELRQWHKVTVELAGPFATESDTQPNPFTDLRFEVTFTHESGAPRYIVPGYFAADGHAAHTSATAGNVWRAHLSPDQPGRWNYRVSFTHGPLAAPNGGGAPLAPFDGASGSFTVEPTDKSGRDFRAHGRLAYVGGHYLRFAGTGNYFLKAGADAPETLLAYQDFDGTEPGRTRAGRSGEAVPVPVLKTWAPHVRDWRPGDPTWRNGKGKGLVGALNYLAGKGANSFSFLTYNAAGDGDNVWPFTARDDKFHYDCSKLDQWGLVFDHATSLGLFLHFKLQENENDDNRLGAKRTPGVVPESLDGGATGPERKLYLRELIARFGHALALNWNLGEENTQSPEEQRAMAQFISDTDPYHHLIVIHSFPTQQDQVYEALLGSQSLLTGASTQNGWSVAHQQTLKWVRASSAAGRPWVVCNDEQGPAGLGVPPDPGYEGFDGLADEGKRRYDLHDIRQATLWGTLLAGGGGIEYYFGYKLPQNDLLCEDWRSRDRSWNYGRIALAFFHGNKIPFWTMTNADELVGNPAHDNSRYCFAKSGELYLVYLPKGGATDLDLTGAHGDFSVAWFNPRTGGPLQTGPVARVTGGGAASLGLPPAEPGDDWLAVVRASR